MISGLDIRPARDADLPGLLAIYNQVIETSSAVYAFAPVDLADRKVWLDARRERGFPVLVAVEEDEVIGFASYGDWRGAWPGYAYTVEHSIHVRDGWRGRGIGRNLLTALLGVAVSQGKHVMIGGIDADNAASIGLHRALGFELVARFSEVGHKFGRWLDLVFMQRRLDDRSSP